MSRNHYKHYGIFVSKLIEMLKLTALFLLRHLLIIHTGVWYAKIKSSFTLGVTLSPIAFIIEKATHWYLDNQTYIYWVCLAIVIDWAVGVIKHLMLKTFSWKRMGNGILLKVGMALMAGLLFEALPYFLKEDNLVSDSLIIVTRLSVFMYPAGSAFMNMTVVTKGEFPPIGWIKWLKSFNENLTIPKRKSDDTDEKGF
jgi:hypothetical protein